MTDSSIPVLPAFADRLSPLRRAALGLQEELSIFEIAKAYFPNDREAFRALFDHLAAMVEAGKLRPAHDWQSRTRGHEPYPALRSFRIEDL